MRVIPAFEPARLTLLTDHTHVTLPEGWEVSDLVRHLVAVIADMTHTPGKEDLMRLVSAAYDDGKDLERFYRPATLLGDGNPDRP